MTSSSIGITQEGNLCGLVVFAVFDDVHIIEKTKQYQVKSQFSSSD